ncbi:hypothetical protein OWV82_021953 [Melia azedarach]|uniref:Uncharacterized protein n=1 Tax=Melia azedarach TaxID=155640 RepID=A0ACC1X2K2_MELAZ|nr:hypothetical protein OWV82_021953 [Melia azedarach]
MQWVAKMDIAGEYESGPWASVLKAVAGVFGKASDRVHLLASSKEDPFLMSSFDVVGMVAGKVWYGCSKLDDLEILHYLPLDSDFLLLYLLLTQLSYYFAC